MPKKELYSRLYQYARRDPENAAKAMDELRKLGHNISTSEGVSIGLDDIEPDYKARNDVMRPALERMQKTNDQSERVRIISEAQEKLLDVAKNFGGSQGLLLRSGGRGNPVQVMRSYLAPVAARTSTGDPYPWLVHHSHSEGLRPSEMISTNIETRNNQVASYLQVTEPGDFSKILVNNMTDQLILEEDCGTTNGLAMATDDPHIVDRFLAGPKGGFTAGTLVTPQVYTRLKKLGGSVLVRSPMTCEAHGGICQKCYGNDEFGKVHTLGTNVGVRSAQAITEPLTQFALSAKHGVRQAGLDKQKVQGISGLRSFLEIPQSFTNRAVLATVTGKVENIEAAPQGGFNVYVGEDRHYVPPHLEPVVRKGAEVHPGDALSEGIPMPNEVVQFKGLGEGRRYIVSQLHDVYKNQGVNLDKRHFEILARAHLNHAQIDRDPEGRFLPGDVVDYPNLLKVLKEDTEEVPLKDATGKMLGRGYLHHMAGTVVTDALAADLKSQGIKEVEVTRKPPELSFMMEPITRNPLLNPDWMARMGHRYLGQSILEGAHYGQKSDIHGTHPIPAYVYGEAFGKGKGKKY